MNDNVVPFKKARKRRRLDYPPELPAEPDASDFCPYAWRMFSEYYGPDVLATYARIEAYEYGRSLLEDCPDGMDIQILCLFMALEEQLNFSEIRRLDLARIEQSTWGRDPEEIRDEIRRPDYRVSGLLEFCITGILEVGVMPTRGRRPRGWSSRSPWFGYRFAHPPGSEGRERFQEPGPREIAPISF